MGKLILNVDCDGVLYDTISVALELMRELGCDMTNKYEIDYYFKKIIDWNELFKRASVINSGIEKVKILKNGDYFDEVNIVTGICSSNNEERIKREIFHAQLPDIKVITVQYGISKALVVPHPESSIFVDDEKRNCINIKKYGGMPILFTRDKMDVNHDIINDILAVPYTKSYKKLIKTRYF